MIMTQGGFSILRNAFGKLTQSQVAEIEFIVSAMNQDKSISYPQAAYMLATTWHETATRMLPIEEYGKGKNRTYGTWYRNSIGALYSFIDGRSVRHICIVSTRIYTMGVVMYNSLGILIMKMRRKK